MHPRMATGDLASVRGIAPALRGGAMTMLKSARALAAGASVLTACITPPTLTLGATSSWQTRDLGVAHAWTAGAQLGWAARTPESSAESTRAEPAIATTDREPEPATPCSFASTCAWEHDARSAALVRARETYEGDLP
jgi:hypothetical protein